MCAFLQNVDVFGPSLATLFCWNLHSFWFSPVPSANSCASIAIIHLGFTWFHVNNAPEEGNPFIPVRNQSIHTSVSSFSSPVPCRLWDRGLRKSGMTRYESKCARRFKKSIIKPEPWTRCSTATFFPTNFSIIQHLHQYIYKWKRKVFV